MSSKYFDKYLKYKKKYFKLKKQAGGSQLLMSCNQCETKYRDIPCIPDNGKQTTCGEYVFHPEEFLKILEDNPIEVTSKKHLIPKSSRGAIHTPWSEVEEMIDTSIDKFLLDDQKNTTYPYIVIIPLFTEQTGSPLQKSNFWFSLLYLKKLYEKDFKILDVVLVFLPFTNTSYFRNLQKNNKKVNAMLFDDGIYSGNQMNNIVLKPFLTDDCFTSVINHISICVPFMVKRKPFIIKGNKEEYITKLNSFKQKLKQIEVTATEGGKNPFHGTGMKKFFGAQKKLNNDYPEISNYQKWGWAVFNIEKYTFYIGSEESYNQDMNRWFDHKKPDGHSFKGYVPNFNPPYAINWKIKGFTANKMDRIAKNANELIFSQGDLSDIEILNIGNEYECEEIY